MRMERIEAKKIPSAELPEIMELGKRKGILDEVNRMREGSHGISKKSHEELENFRDSVLSLPEYQAYQKSKINLSILESLVEDFNAQTKNNLEKAQIENTRKILHEMVESIESGIESYYRIAMQQQHILGKFNMDPAQYKADLMDADRHRR